MGDFECFNGSLDEDDELDNHQSVGSVLSDKISSEEVLDVGMASKSDTVSSGMILVSMVLNMSHSMEWWTVMSERCGEGRRRFFLWINGKIRCLYFWRLEVSDAQRHNIQF